MSIYVHSTFHQVTFVSNAVKTYCTENQHGVQCANDTITVIDEAIKQRISTSPNIKDFPIESNIDGINKETEYITQLDGTNTKRERLNDNKKNAFSITLPSFVGDVD